MVKAHHRPGQKKYKILKNDSSFIKILFYYCKPHPSSYTTAQNTLQKSVVL